MSAPRKNNPALKSNVSESAICAMTSKMPRREEAVEPSDMRRLADLLFQIIHQVGPRSLQRRSEAEEERGDKADQKSDREDRRIGPQMNHDGKVHRTEKIS